MESSARISVDLSIGTRRTEFQSRVAAELWLNIAGKDFRLVGKTVKIGRSSENDIVLDDKSVSRYHALLTITPTQVILEDLKSRNGIRVNGAAIRRAELKDRDQVRIGDLEGLFFHRLRAAGSNKASAWISKLSEMGFDKITPLFELGKSRAVIERLEAGKLLLDRFNRLEKKRKMMIIAIGAAALLTAFNFLSSPSRSLTNASSTNEERAQVVDKPVDRRAFDRCLEYEDLGNYRQAVGCLKALSFTPDVQSALERVKKLQDELSQRRYEEALRAFDNYYYDIAIQKWQEVLLIADEGSKFRIDSMRGIQSAEERKKLR